MSTKTCPKCHTEIDARATICPACRSKQPAFSRLLSVLLIFGFIAIVVGSMTGEKKAKPTTAESKPPIAEPKPTNANEGDTVAIRYPASTILCTDRGDASKIYLAGELALRETLRLENSASKAVQAKYDARKVMMREAYSCTWPSDDARYRVEHKQITGSKDVAFYTVAYCLREEGGSACRWLLQDAEGAERSPPFVEAPARLK
jgi:hypothetical protein